MITLAVAALFAAAATCLWFDWKDVSAEELLVQAREALAAKNYAAAEEICLCLIGRQGPFPPALLAAGEAAAKQGRLTEALGYYAQIPEGAGQEAAAGHAAAGVILLNTHHASAAEAQFRRALIADPHLLIAHERLGYLLSVEGRRWESLPHLFAQLRADHFQMEVLLLFGDHRAATDRAAELESFRKSTPDDPMLLIGEARQAFRRNCADEAKRLLEKVVSQFPKQIEAQAALGRLMLAEADPELDRWLVDAAPDAEAHPDVWLIRGLWAKRRGDKQGAARCFWEAIKRDPTHQAAIYQLAQALESLGDTQAGRRFAELAKRTEALCTVIDILRRNPSNPALLHQAAEMTESLGRAWEAFGWHEFILTNNPQDIASLSAMRRLEPLLEKEPPLVLDSENPAKQIDLSDFALPRWDATSLGVRSSLALEPPSYRANYADVAARAGIDFRYYAGSDCFENGRRMFQFTGGGVAVLDYDADGWPDVYMTQGCRWPPAPGPTKHLDRLYRNRGDGTFQDVTEDALLTEDRFSQGVAAGDFNNDGFVDLYVANIGVNRLYMNQGDGTFRDHSDAAGIDGETWTTSCLLADLNGDGLPDIYDANYLQGPDVYKKVCSDHGIPRTCTPTIFEPQPDRFYLNLGDGRFEERTEAAGLNVAGGNGLGVVAGDLDGSGRLSLFVANDEDANFCFIHETQEPGALPKFVERGVLAGLAYDGDGKALACMGVAAGDVNGDGKLDLYVTNFYDEPNTLYLQDSGGMFVDGTSAAGLRAPSYHLLGFGAQFLDGDLDGVLDLVVTNGHIEDLSYQQIPFKMPPQYFRGLGGGKFAELPPAEAGEFFQGKYLGRGLARLDWNRDGRDDFVVSHLDAPAALVANASTETGRHLAVQLRGVKSSRDAIGATVTLVSAGRRRTQWLTAGDGYQASNERKLIFGLGAETRVEKLEIHWPSGLTQQFADLAANQELIFVEGSSRATPLPPVR